MLQKRIGLIGGMSWESTLLYYKMINQLINKRLGKMHSADLILHSVDFQPIQEYQHQNDWGKAAAILIQAAQNLEQAGAAVILICTNTMHKLYDQIAQEIKVPLLHIADGTGKSITDKKLKKVGLLATKFTMQEAFYRQRLEEHYQLEVLTPNEDEQKSVHNIIYNELCFGTINPASKHQILQIIQSLQKQGVEGLILGCTELVMLINQHDVALTLFDTTQIHAEQAVEYSLQ